MDEVKTRWGVKRNIPKGQEGKWNDTFDPFTKEKVRSYRVVCGNCGHTVSFLRNAPLICNWCRHTVYPTKKTEFREKLILELRKKDKDYE